jgi:hypothetical protein
MRRALFLLATLSLAPMLPAAAQDRVADGGRDGSAFFFRADAPFARAVLPYTVEQVRATLPEAYRRLGFTARVAATRDTTQRDLATSYMQIRGQLYPGEANSLYFECGRNSPSGPLADQGDITFAMLSRVEPGSRGGAEVLTQITARARRRDSSQYPVDCLSTGRLEATLAQFAAEQLQRGSIEIRRNR